jgi:hypothetical protein
MPHRAGYVKKQAMLDILQHFLLITNLTRFFNVFIYLFYFSTCFEQPSSHHQENQLYQYIIWYMSLCVGD